MTTVIILLAGMGRRMGMDKNKILLEVNDRPIFMYTLEKFEQFTDNIIVVVNKNDYEYFKSLNLKYKIVIGGVTRHESVLNALKEVNTERVLIHDGARPLISSKVIKECLECKSDAYFAGIPLKNTVRYDKSNNFKDLNRGHLIDVQTPQGGLSKLFLEGALKNHNVTDDISMLSDRNNVELIIGEDTNIKITTKFDLEIFKMLEGKND